GFGARTRAVVNLFSSIGLLVTSVLVVWLSLNFVNQAYVIDEGSPDPGGLPHRFILKSMIPLGFGLLALQAVAHIILYSKRALGR
ncbi:MAG TPA: TRAP transporter small permease subunit, partial [Hyphomicrobiaceae bacterium]